MVRGTVGSLLVGSRKLRIGLAVVLIVALVGVGLAQLYPLLDRKSTLQSAETTTGTVTHAEYVRNRYDIRYEYTVDGRTYENTRVFPAPYAPRGTGDIESVPFFEPGEQTTVHYDPADPGYSWLTTRGDLVSRHVVYFAALAFVAVVLAAYLYVELNRPKLSGSGDPTQGDLPAGADAMMAAMADVDSDNPPSQAEILDRTSDQLPREVVERMRTPEGELDPSQLDEAVDQYSDVGARPGQRPGPDGHPNGHPGGSTSGLFGSVGTLLGLLKGAGLIVLIGGLLVLASSVALTQLLTP